MSGWRGKKVDPARRKGKGLALVSRPDKSSAPSVPVPDLRVGQVRCPVCRNGVGLTPTGRVRSHVDLFGNLCHNRSNGEHLHVEAQPVVLDDGNAQPLIKADAGSLCRECGKWLPGERRLCGRCFAMGDAS